MHANILRPCSRSNQRCTPATSDIASLLSETCPRWSDSVRFLKILHERGCTRPHPTTRPGPESRFPCGRCWLRAAIPAALRIVLGPIDLDIQAAGQSRDVEPHRWRTGTKMPAVPRTTTAVYMDVDRGDQSSSWRARPFPSTVILQNGDGGAFRRRQQAIKLP